MMRAMQHVPLDSSAPATPANGWPPLLLSRIERELTPFIGPLAGTLVRRAARRHDTPEGLVLALAPSIEDAKERDAFVRACRRHTPWPSAPAAATVPAAPPAQATAAAPLRPPPTQSTLPSATYPNASRRQAVTPRALSPHWRGVATRGQRDLALLPLWAAAAFAGVLLLASWFALNTRLDARARPLFARIAAVPTVLQDPAAPAVAAKPRLSAELSADVEAARLEVRDEAQRSIVTLPADALFAHGSTRLDPRASDLLARVANALRSHAGGEISVIGHGDAAPSLQYPSNWHFTRARAQAVADALLAHAVAPARAEGRAEFEPRVPGSGSAERARNRRIEIELRLPRPEELQP
jgi:flagellar motor protein MotB